MHNDVNINNLTADFITNKLLSMAIANHRHKDIIRHNQLHSCIYISYEAK